MLPLLLKLSFINTTGTGTCRIYYTRYNARQSHILCGIKLKILHALLIEIVCINNYMPDAI